MARRGKGKYAPESPEIGNDANAVETIETEKKNIFQEMFKQRELL